MAQVMGIGLYIHPGSLAQFSLPVLSPGQSKQWRELEVGKGGGRDRMGW